MIVHWNIYLNLCNYVLIFLEYHVLYVHICHESRNKLSKKETEQINLQAPAIPVVAEIFELQSPDKPTSNQYVCLLWRLNVCLSGEDSSDGGAIVMIAGSRRFNSRLSHFQSSWSFISWSYKQGTHNIWS